MTFNILEFAKEAYGELKKVSWLSQQEALGTTIAVIILVILVAIYISAVDFIMAQVLSFVLGR